ncbi:MAG: hypothetical protein EBR81_11250 [Proteobacteria bacterium]|nr:hypothetical protein [Pseudomonadota bacterium]
MLTGHVTWLYAFDIAHDMRREPLKTVLGRPVEPWLLATDHRVPRQSFFHRPQTIRLPPLESALPGGGSGNLERTLKILPVGGLSLAITAPVCVDSLSQLVPWHEPPNLAAASAMRSLAQMVVQDIREHLIQPIDFPEETEAYTVFRLDPPTDQDAVVWLAQHRREVAALLTQELDAERLCTEEVAETTSRYLGYYKDDILVVDWDAALLLDRPGPAREILHVLELANLQLCELEAYDRLLDSAMERSYTDLSRRRQRNGALLRKLGELRIDLSRLSDELTHAGKFLGDWHLARVYEAASSRFHLSDWQRVVDDKLKTLDDLYQTLKHDQFNRWLLILELVVIVILVLEATLVIYPLLRR